MRYLAVITLENNGVFIFRWRAQVAIKTVVRGIEFAVSKPLVKRRIGFVKNLVEWLFPAQVVAGKLGPETFEILFSILTHCVISIHTGNTGCVNNGWAGRKHAIFNQQGFDIRCGRTH